jgi:autotransporter-associated beta strand protein
MKNNILNTVRNFKFAIVALTALSLAGWSSDAKAATEYWNTNGTSGTWTNSLWGTTASGPFNTAWGSSNDVVFGGSANALATFATTAVGNITVNTDTTITAAGTLTNKAGGSIIDVATGKTLTWTGQSWSTAAAQVITKNGLGTWNIGAQANTLIAGSSFTLNGGTVIVGGNNSFGGVNSALNINGGTINSSGTRAYANSAITIGGDFENSGTGNATWSGTVALGGATRTINNTTASGSRSYTGIISGAAGSGLTFSGAGAGQTFIGNTNNSFSGPITITGSEVIFNDNGAFGGTTSITLDGGRLTMGIDSSGSALTNGTINASRNIYVGSTAGTSLSVSKTNGLTTYNGVIANKDGSTGLLAKQGAGTLVLGGVSTYSGATAINNGTVKLDAGNNRLPTGTVVSFGTATNENIGALDLNGRNQQIAGLVSVTGTNTNTATKNTVTSAAAATLEVNVANGTTNSFGAGTTQNSGVITGALALVKSGLGTQVLGDANTYSGGTTVNAGTLALSGSGTLGSTSGTVAIGAGTLDLGAQSRTSGAFTLDSGTLRNGTLTAASYALNNSGTVSAALAGAGALTKSGTGNATLSGANTYAGTTTVNAGTLSVDGSLLNSGSVVVNANGFLGGSGSVGAIRGAGTVGPGNSPGILTATSVDPTLGTDFKFEITSANPVYTSATSSGNDLLHLTASNSPFAGGTFTSGNIISIYLNSSTINDSLLLGQNTTFSGGFFVDGTYGLAAALSPASFAYYTTSALLGTGPAVDYNGTSYYSLNSEIAAKTTLTDTAVASAGFSTGTVAGTVLTFNAVPEPSAQSLFAFGMVALVAVRAVRRGRGNS